MTVRIVRINVLTMALLDSNAFKLFLVENGRIYPYRDVRTTRRRMHVSWLMIKCERIGRMESDVKWRPVPAISFNNDTVTYLIVSKQALPVPASIAEVLDVMEGWGKSYDIVCYNCVVAYMGYLLRAMGLK